jgi:3-keto-5-aminohexanoate cleavage enzyme
MAPRQDVPVIIEVAVNGVTKKDANPHVPITPDEIAADALACIEAGAAIVHEHDMVGDPESSARLALEAYEQILAERPDALLYPTTAFGAPDIEYRWRHNITLADKGVLRMAFLDPGSANLGGFGPDGLPRPTANVYTNTFADIAWIVEQCERLRVGPSMAIFEPGFLRVALAYERAGRMPAGAFVKLYFGGGGSSGGLPGLAFGLPPTKPSLDAYLAMLDGSRLPWAVAVLSGDCVESGMARLALEAGGHVRVGLEDHGGARTPANVELVREVVALAGDVGRPVATPAEAAALLALPTAA